MISSIVPGRSIAMVTGATSGIGAAFAERLAADGCNLVIVSSNVDRLHAAAEGLRARHPVVVEAFAADLSSESGVASVERWLATRGGLEMLVNDAGFGTIGPFWELDSTRERAEVAINVIAVVRLTRAALPAMVERGHGTIINVASIGAFRPVPFNATYGATKAFVKSFTEAIHEELRGTGVHVQALCPGFTRTEFHTRARIDASDIPQAVWSTPEAVVEASLRALAKDRAVCVPGAINRVALAIAAVTPRRFMQPFMARFMRRHFKNG